MDERFEQGIRDFNEGRYFEAHDVLEDLWEGYRAPDRLFVQGLIQAAVAFYHLENGNFIGARSLLQKACRKLDGYLPEYWGLSTDLLQSTLRNYLMRLQSQDHSEEESIKDLVRPKIEYISSSDGNHLSIV